MDSSLLITAAQLIDGTGAPPVANAAVLVEGERIRAVGSRDQVGTPAGARVVDLGQRTLLPGLIDCHAHMSFTFPGDNPVGAPDPPEVLALRAARNARLCLRAGVTTARVVGEPGFVDVAYKQASESGLLEGPRLRIATRPLVSAAFDIIISDVRVTGTDAIRKVIQENIRRGADLIKSYATGTSTAREFYPYFTQAEAEATVEEAHRFGRKVAVHCHGGPGLGSFVRAGVDSVEHALWATGEDVALMAERGTFVVPTAGFWLSQDPSKVNPAMARAIRQAGNTIALAKKHGVRICAGSDGGHGRLAFEIECLVKWGLTEMEAIVAATGRAAELLGWDEVGTLQAGRFADLVAVDGNPLADIRALWRVDWVAKGGNVVRARPELLVERPAVPA
ncbi:MAG: amidohydrolase family protein [Chloroflexi bacterium]|nr:amidohydrolase family protein [Chloroflexota bacterium]